MRGYGFTALLFEGMEYFINESFSLNVDIGPCLTVLFDSEDPSINVAGIDLVINLGFNYYFKKKGKGNNVKQ